MGRECYGTRPPTDIPSGTGPCRLGPRNHRLGLGPARHPGGGSGTLPRRRGNRHLPDTGQPGPPDPRLHSTAHQHHARHDRAGPLLLHHFQRVGRVRGQRTGHRPQRTVRCRISRRQRIAVEQPGLRHLGPSHRIHAPVPPVLAAVPHCPLQRGPRGRPPRLGRRNGHKRGVPQATPAGGRAGRRAVELHRQPGNS